MNPAPLFYFLAGTSQAAIRDCPESERNYHAAIGGFVLITGTAAALSGGYALYTIFGSVPISVLFGLFWGLTIGAVDRFIVMTLDLTMYTSRAKGLVAAGSRLVIAFFVAFVIARPLELRIFAPEINARLQGEVAAQRDLKIAQIEADLERRQAAHEDNDQIESQQARLTQLSTDHGACLEEQAALRQQVHGECDGTAGTRRVGVGPICRLKQLDLEEVKARCADLNGRLVATEASLTALSAERDRAFAAIRSDAEAQILAVRQGAATKIAAIGQGKEGSLLTRLDALHGLSNEGWGLWWAVWFITTLFILIEAMPVGLKLMVAGKGTYPRRLQLDEKESAKRHRIERKLRERQRIKHRTVLAEITDAVREQQRERVLETIAKGDNVVANDVNLELRRRTEVASQDLAEARLVFPDDLDDEDPVGQPSKVHDLRPEDRDRFRR